MKDNFRKRQLFMHPNLAANLKKKRTVNGLSPSIPLPIYCDFNLESTARFLKPIQWIVLRLY